ncbi:MAG: hypothetical protein LC749_02975 [Actinobacteria bacterium]|nr:hypothetical protein [Actinomycetota bacterium]
MTGRGASGTPTPQTLRTAYPVSPALVDERRWNGWACHRFWREVTEAILAWLSDLYDPTRGWHDTGHFDGDTPPTPSPNSPRTPTGSRSPSPSSAPATPPPAPTTHNHDPRRTPAIDPTSFVDAIQDVLTAWEATGIGDPVYPANGWPWSLPGQRDDRLGVRLRRRPRVGGGSRGWVALDPDATD